MKKELKQCSGETGGGFLEALKTKTAEIFSVYVFIRDDTMLVFLTVVLNKQKTRLQQIALVTLVSIFLSYDSCEWGNDS